MPRSSKKFHEYISEATGSIVPLEHYHTSPATAFLKFVVQAKNASNQCERNFQRNAEKSLPTINAGLLAAIMGNFETYQKYLFSEIFENTIYLKKFDIRKFISNIEKITQTSITIDLLRFSAYRQNPTAAGLVLADSLKNWHVPSIVNKYFSSFSFSQPRSLYSNDTIESLSILWQMRHSIVHTAGTITIPDAQKIETLNDLAGKAISLEPQFIHEVARKFHKIIKEATRNAETMFWSDLESNVPEEAKQIIKKLFEIKSSISAWLK